MLRLGFKQLLQHTAGYSLQAIVAPLVTLIMTPLYTRALGDEQYGMLSLLAPLASILFNISLLGITTSLPAYYYEKDDQEHRQQVMASAISISIIWSLIWMGGMIVFAQSILSVYAQPIETNLLRWLAFGQLFLVIYTIQGTLLRLKQDIKRSNILALSYVSLYAILGTFLVLVLDLGIKGVIQAQVGTYILTSIFGIWLAPEALRSLPNWSMIKKMVRVGIPLIPMSLGAWLLMYEDRVFLAQVVSLEQLGIYEAAVRMASFVGIALMPFQAAWIPFALSIKEEPHAKNIYTRTLIYFTVIALGLSLGIVCFGRELVWIFTGPEFLGAERYIWVLVLMPINAGLQAITVLGLYIKQQLGKVFWSMFWAVVINTLLNVLLIPYFGVMGAAIATGAAYISVPLITAYFSHQVEPINYDWGRIIGIFILYIGLSITALFFLHTSTWSALLIRASLLLWYSLGILALLESTERHMILKALRQPKRFVQQLWRIRKKNV